MTGFLSKTVHLHTRVLDSTIIEELARRGIVSVEIDVSSDNGNCYIGHHMNYYKENGFTYPPSNVSVNDAIAAAKQYGWFVKFDWKDRGSCDCIRQCAKRLNPNSYMHHAFASELNFSGKQHYEDIPFDDIQDLQRANGNPPLQVSCRGLTNENLEDHVDKIIKTAVVNKVMVINFNLPDNSVPQDAVLREVHKRNMLAEAYMHKISGRDLPVPVFRTTDSIEEATRKIF